MRIGNHLQRSTATLLLALLLLGVSPPLPGQTAPPSEPAPVAAPALDRALAGAQAAIAACAAQGWPHVAVTVLDSGGEMKAMLSADGTPPGPAVPRSAMKAATALAYRIPSGEVQKRAAADQALAAAVAADPKLLPRAGGEPIVIAGTFLGAIGVSGAPGADKDDLCALAGLAAISRSR